MEALQQLAADVATQVFGAPWACGGLRCAARRGLVGKFQRVDEGCGRLQGSARLGLVDLHRAAVEVFVGKEFGGASEVDDGEPAFAQVFVQAAAPADDLFELCHRRYVPVDHDELAGGGIDPCARQLGTGDDDGEGLFGVDEVFQFVLVIGVVAGDLPHVAGLGCAQVGVGLGEGLAHAGGMVRVFAKHNGFGVAVRGLEVFGDPGGCGQVALFGHGFVQQHAAGVVFDHYTIRVGQVCHGVFGEGVALQIDTDDFVGCKVAVFDALPKTVAVDGRTEVIAVDGGAAEPDLGGAGKVVEDFAPHRVFGRAAVVAFVDHDEVEKVGAELFVDVVVLFAGACDDPA